MRTPLLRRARAQWSRRFVRRPVYFSTLTCPHCDKRSHDQMPANACVYFYHCMRCNAVFKPLPGDCCVYCSYGDVPCLPRQFEEGAMMADAVSRGSTPSITVAGKDRTGIIVLMMEC